MWWKSMANVVIFGLLIATVLTLVVVPTLYYLTARFEEFRQQAAVRIKNLYWRPYALLAGEPRPNEEK
jgi:hypothetical protein